MQNFMISQSNPEYAARFRMLNLNAMAPSLAAFGQSHFSKAMMPPFPFIRPDGLGTNSSRLPLGKTFHQSLNFYKAFAPLASHFERLMSSSSLSSARSSCSSSTGSTATAPVIRSSNVKKYRCDICDKTFSRSNTLITHKVHFQSWDNWKLIASFRFQRIHTGEKPFRCEVCSRAFRQPGNLTRHRLTHTTVGFCGLRHPSCSQKLSLMALF